MQALLLAGMQKVGVMGHHHHHHQQLSQQIIAQKSPVSTAMDAPTEAMAGNAQPNDPMAAGHVSLQQFKELEGN